MTRKVLPGIGVALLLVFLMPFWQGCGLDPPSEPPKEVPLPPWPPESPQDVIDNMEYAYNQMDYERYEPLFLDDFTFVFEESDIGIPGIPPDGLWGKTDELESARHMLDLNFTPSDPDNKIDNMQLELQFSGDLIPSNYVDAPDEALMGFVTFDLRVNTVGVNIYLVNSRPDFYFAHKDTISAGTDTTFIWGLWLIEDAPFGAPALTAEVPKK